MKIIQPSHEIIAYTPNLLETIERAGRTCYKSEDKITADSAEAFIERIKNFKHESVLEHGVITVLFTTDRGVTHELVRHRVASFSQESTRYVNYSKGKFGCEITVVEPPFWHRDAPQWREWYSSCMESETSYMRMVSLGCSAQEARSVLPNSLKTEIVVSANPREWRHIMQLRTHRDAHPQIVQLMQPLLKDFRQLWPVLFDDVGYVDN